NYEALAGQARALATEWQAKASGTNFIESLLASVTPEAQVPAQGARILVIMNGDAMVLRNGASRVALAQFAYLQAAGYRVCGFFLAHAPEAISGSLEQWMRDLSDRLAGFDLEAVFVAGPGRLAIEQWRDPADSGPSIEADLEAHRHFDVSAGLLGYLRQNAVDAVLLNYVTAYPVVETIGLADRPVICEMHDLQALQKGIYGRRLVSPRDIEAELAVLGRCAHLVSLNPDEAVFVADRLPGVPIAITGIFPVPPKSVTEVLAGCRDLIDVVTSAKPSTDLTRLRSALGPFDGIDMLFVGSNHLPNIKGLRWFLDEVFLPNLAKHRKTLVVAGSVTDGGEWPTSPYIVYLGRVGDLAPLYAATRIVLLPILEGGGSSVKTAEALVHGVPIVATSSALRGIDQAAWQGVVVADDPDGYGRAILDLLGDAARRQRIGRAAEAMATAIGGESRYDGVMNDVFRHVLGKAAAVVMRNPAARAALDEPSFEWNGQIAAANSIVRDWLDDVAFDPKALRALTSAPPREAGALVDTFVKTLLIDQTAVLLESNDDLLRRVVKPGVSEGAAQIGLFVAAARASGGAARTSRETTILVSSAREDLTIRAVAPDARETSASAEAEPAQVLRAARSAPYSLAAREISVSSHAGLFEAGQWLRFERDRLILGEPMVEGGRILPDGSLEIPGNETVTLVLPALMEPGMRELELEFASRGVNAGRIEFAHGARKVCLAPIIKPPGSSYIEVLAASGREMPFAPWRISLHALDETIRLDGIAMRLRFGASLPAHRDWAATLGLSQGAL
ncbi:MAG: glycosyltransferase family 4 protein, partial [Beijerinckiaceae bacterium]|nr:glycosyltransferase family 4 protein [Beijerinckiaceae bacterium]